MIEHFSDRHGYRPDAVPITIRDDAPDNLRGAIPWIAEGAGISPRIMREVTCKVLLVQPDSMNWSDYPNVWDEVCEHVRTARWYKVYDIAEALYARLVTSEGRASRSVAAFERRLNDFFVENGIGYELQDGQIVYRGSELFARSTREVPDHLDKSDFPRAANEMREALGDISRRPADITGAIQHAMAALEATAREVTGEPKPTLGKLVPRLGLPKPLDQAVHKIWGYASERGRHISEGQEVGHAEAELIVTVAGSVCAFLAQRQP